MPYDLVPQQQQEPLPAPAAAAAAEGAAAGDERGGSAAADDDAAVDGRGGAVGDGDAADGRGESAGLAGLAVELSRGSRIARGLLMMALAWVSVSCCVPCRIWVVYRRACVHACVRACGRACVCACVRACVLGARALVTLLSRAPSPAIPSRSPFCSNLLPHRLAVLRRWRWWGQQLWWRR